MSNRSARIANKPANPWGSLPPRIKVLYITTLHRHGKRLIEAFQADSATEILLHEAVGGTAGMARLREEVFDVILVAHEPEILDALELIEGLRASGVEEPVIVLGQQSEMELAAFCLEVGADGYCCLGATTTRSLIWTFSRAVERHQLIRENRRLVQADRQRLQYEHQEAARLLAQQRELLAALESLECRTTKANDPSSNDNGARQDFIRPLPESLVAHYREMLRAYVIMGSGNLSGEMSRLAELLSSAEVTARQTMQLHIQVLEEIVRGLGSRSARHVMNRADMLVLEVLIHLSERYRSRYLDRTRPAEQRILPGFEEEALLTAASRASA